jgi:hypothetical protein
LELSNIFVFRKKKNYGDISFSPGIFFFSKVKIKEKKERWVNGPVSEPTKWSPENKISPMNHQVRMLIVFWPLFRAASIVKYRYLSFYIIYRQVKLKSKGRGGGFQGHKFLRRRALIFLLLLPTLTLHYTLQTRSPATPLKHHILSILPTLPSLPFSRGWN